MRALLMLLVVLGGAGCHEAKWRRVREKLEGVEGLAERANGREVSAGLPAEVTVAGWPFTLDTNLLVGGFLRGGGAEPYHSHVALCRAPDRTARLDGSLRDWCLGARYAMPVRYSEWSMRDTTTDLPIRDSVVLDLELVVVALGEPATVVARRSERFVVFRRWPSTGTEEERRTLVHQALVRWKRGVPERHADCPERHDAVRPLPCGCVECPAETR